MIRSFLVLLFISYTYTLATADSLFVQHRFHRLNEEMGLENSVINDIVEDKFGQIWVATEFGLFRYNGFTFESFFKERDNPNSLPHNYVSKLYVSEDNQIWIMTESGIGLYDYTKDEIVRYKPDKIQGAITSMGIGNDGNFYFGSFQGVIYKCDGEEVKTNQMVLDHDMLMGVSKITIVDDVLWAVRLHDGIVKYDLKTAKLKHYSSQELMGVDRAFFYDIYSDDLGEVWFPSDHGLFKATKVGEEFKIVQLKSDELPKDDYLTVFRDESNKVWLGTRQNGFYSFFNPDSTKITDLNHFSPGYKSTKVSHRTISKIFQDKKGLLWLGTHNGGINIFNPSGEKVRRLTYYNDGDQSLSNKSAWGIYESYTGDLWVGTDGGGLNVLNPFTGKISLAKWPLLKKMAILSVYEDPDQNLWLGTYENGLIKIDLNSDNIKQYKLGGNNNDFIVNDIRAIHRTDNGNFFIGTNRGGLYQYSQKEDYFHKVIASHEMDIRSIVSIDDRNLMLGTYRFGLINLNYETNIIKSYPSDAEKIAQDVIFSMTYHNDRLWICTRESGLLIFNTKTKQYETEPALDNLVGKPISAVGFDMNNNAWVTTFEGISCYSTEKKELYLFNEDDGIQKGRFNMGSLVASKNNYIAVGGIYGLNLFNPNDLLIAEPSEKVVLNSFKIFDQVMTPENSSIYPKEKSIFLTDRVNLSHSDNVFSIVFSKPGFNYGKREGYAYILENYEENWVTGSYSNDVTYRNVTPGNYKFKVKEISSCEVIKELDIVISPPFWLSWPAYLFYFVVVTLSLRKYNSFKNSRIALKKDLEFEQAMREKDKLSMQEKLRFYTNFSHELKTPLTLIQGPVNDLLKKEKDDEDVKHLIMIKKNTSILLKFISRMLEFRKLEQNKSILNVASYDLNIVGQEIAESFTHLAKEKGVLFGYYSENDLNVWVDIEKVQIAISNLLSNAIKFSEADQKVKFSLFHKEDDVIIEVKDEGEGIKKSELEHIFSPFYQASNSVGSGGTGIGLALSKNFIELHGGKIEVNSAVGKGSTFRITLRKGKTHLEEIDVVRYLEVKPEEDTFKIPSGNNDEKQEVINDSNKIILVVDDNKDIADYVSNIFSSESQVIKCYNGQDALEKAKTLLPTIIISDMMMPSMDGLEFCKLIKENIATSHIPIILLTAKNSDNSKMKGFEVGADDYITKPFNSDLLKVRVNNLIKNRKLLEVGYSASELVDIKTAKSTREAEFIIDLESKIVEMVDNGNFNVQELCTELGFSQTTLYRKVKSLTGDSIQLFAKKIKIKKAAQMMLQEDMTITEIAFSLDFSDMKYFRKCFKEQYKMTPTEYKKNNMVI
ncbi:two-component regulator propeller domain-containing protein [Flammeovirga sp. EKP202]|uniref:hybrid sensor histidine kinase/response regulator transcription factor n=1 Tax=Flammeovirga sp. EKP202 TaxID=2770592 RepID=UPI00165F2AB3|nr:two-component regulator propeller domain-containing protein [Flammeovirga sp. EKP202]MBD0404670.1 response regulator [Flammeovirga sp. EKP202]